MPYNPSVNDQSGQILAGYQMKAADIDLQTKQFLGEQIGNVGTALTGVLAKKQEEASKAATLGSALNTMNKILPMYGQEGIDLQNTITQRMTEAGTNLDKMSGVWMASQPAVENFLSMKRQQAQIDGYKELYTQKAQAAADAKAAQPPKYDFNYATEFNKALYDNGITDPEQRKQKFNEAGIGHLYDKFINPPKQNMGFFGPITQ